MEFVVNGGEVVVLEGFDDVIVGYFKVVSDFIRVREINVGVGVVFNNYVIVDCFVVCKFSSIGLVVDGCCVFGDGVGVVLGWCYSMLVILLWFYEMFVLWIY